jgi:hypothetical protein
MENHVSNSLGASVDLPSRPSESGSPGIPARLKRPRAALTHPGDSSTRRTLLVEFPYIPAVIPKYIPTHVLEIYLKQSYYINSITTVLRSQVPYLS